MKNQMIFKVLMFLLGAFILIGGGLLFVLQPELALGYKLLAVGAGVSVLGILLGIFVLTEAIAYLFEKLDTETAAIKEGIAASKEGVEILEAINIVEIKKNKAVKDIYDLMVENKGGVVSGTGSENNQLSSVKVEIDTSKLEDILKEIKSAVLSTQINNQTIKSTITDYKTEVKEDTSVSVEEEIAEIKQEKEETKEEIKNIEEVIEEKEEIVKDKIEEINQELNQDIEEEISNEIVAEIEKEEEEISFTLEKKSEETVEESIKENKDNDKIEKEDVIESVVKTSPIMSPSDYFTEEKPLTVEENVLEEKEVVEEEIVIIPEKKSEEIKQNMVYDLTTEEPVAKSNKKAIQFADVVIEDIIRDMLEKPSEEILESDLMEIDVVLAGNQGVKRLEGIENLVNLQKLDLWKAEISNIEILKALKKLVYLRLSKTMVTDLTPIRELENLEELYLQEVPVESLKPLSSLQRLKYLYLEKTKIDSLEPLLEISTLEELYLWGAVVDLTPGGVNSEVLKALESRGCSIIK